MQFNLVYRRIFLFNSL